MIEIGFEQHDDSQFFYVVIARQFFQHDVECFSPPLWCSAIG